MTVTVRSAAPCLALAALAAGCAGPRPPGRSILEHLEPSRWTEEGAAPHPLLREGVERVTWRKSLAVPPLRVRVLREGEETLAVERVEDLRPFLVPLDTPARALLYSNLLRSFEIDGESVPGPAITYAGDHPRILGTYDAADAARWGIPGGDRVREVPGGFAVVRPVFEAAPRSRGVPTGPDRVRLIEETLGRDGSYGFRHLRTVEEGYDLTRFVVLLR